MNIDDFLINKYRLSFEDASTEEINLINQFMDLFYLRLLDDFTLEDEQAVVVRYDIWLDHF